MLRTPSLEQVPLNVGAVGSAVPVCLVLAHLVSPFSASSKSFSLLEGRSTAQSGGDPVCMIISTTKGAVICFDPSKA